MWINFIIILSGPEPLMTHEKPNLKQIDTRGTDFSTMRHMRTRGKRVTIAHIKPALVCLGPTSRTIGGDLIYIKVLRFKIWKKIIYFSTAKDIFKFKLIKIYLLIDMKQFTPK